MAMLYKTSNQDGIDFIEYLETKPTGGVLGNVKKAIDIKFLDIENNNLIDFGRDIDRSL